MYYLKAVLFVGYFIERVLMQWYVISPETPFFSTDCKENQVFNVVHCVAFGRASKNARVFFNAENNRCRWNCTFLYKNGIMGADWHHYAIESTKNAAQSNVLAASSIYANDPLLWGVRYATDGIMPDSQVNIFSSHFEQSPWFMVTLERSFTVQFVRIFNRRDGLGSRFHDVALDVSVHGSLFERKGFFKGPGITNQVIEILLDNPTAVHTDCKEKQVFNVVHCVAYGRASKNARVFFNAANNRCRWNCTFLYKNGIMGAEWHHYAIESKKNAAQSNVLAASSIYANEPLLWGVHYATDGIMPDSGVNIFSSHFEQSPWFMVTLDRPLTVQFIRIFNRRDQLGSRFHDVALDVSVQGSLFERKGFFKGPGITNQVIEILLDNPTAVQYVRIQISQGTNNILNFVEMEIYTSV